MFPLIGLAGGALSLLSSLLQSSAASNSSTSSKATASTANNPLTALEQSLTDAGGSGSQAQNAAGGGVGAPPLSSGTLAALIALQGQGGTDASSGASGLFAKLDSDGDGTVSKGEFENVLGKAGVDTNSADALFSKLDANGDGSISKGEMKSARNASFHAHHHQVAGGGGGGAASLLKATNADGSQSQTTSNADGTTTTTITYADGSTVSTTTPATPGGGSRSSGQGNLLERLIQLQASLTSPASGTSGTVA